MLRARRLQAPFREVLKAQTRDAQADSRAQRGELTRQQALLVAQQDRLLNLRIAAVAIRAVTGPIKFRQEVVPGKSRARWISVVEWR